MRKGRMLLLSAVLALTLAAPATAERLLEPEARKTPTP
jgi:hypothetical protein